MGARAGEASDAMTRLGLGPLLRRVRGRSGRGWCERGLVTSDRRDLRWAGPVADSGIDGPGCDVVTSRGAVLAPLVTSLDCQRPCALPCTHLPRSRCSVWPTWSTARWRRTRRTSSWTSTLGAAGRGARDGRGVQLWPGGHPGAGVWGSWARSAALPLRALHCTAHRCGSPSPPRPVPPLGGAILVC